MNRTVTKIAYRTADLIAITPFINEVIINHDGDPNYPLAIGSVVLASIIDSARNNSEYNDGYEDGSSVGRHQGKMDGIRTSMNIIEELQVREENGEG